MTAIPLTGRARSRVLSSARAFGAALRARTRPIRAHLRDHSYTLVGFGFISASSFVHSLYTGLLITGILALVFEWKVSDS